MQLQPKVYKILIGFFKTTLFFAIAWIIYDQINQEHFDLAALDFKPISILLLLLVGILSIVNWGIEAKKWQVLLGQTYVLSFKESYQAVLSGLATGMITPNRWGGFIGRILSLPKNHKGVGTIYTFLGSWAQMFITVLIGTCALFGEPVGDLKQMRWMFLLFVPVIAALYFLKPISFLNKWKEKKWHESLSRTVETTMVLRWKVLGLSLVRYSVFFCQFYFLLTMVGMNVSILIVWDEIALIYLITTVIPSPVLMKLGVRESAALLLLVNFGSTSQILIATLLLWLMNIAIPALIGSIMLKNSQNRVEGELKC